MGIGVIEIIVHAIGIGIFAYLAFELIWEAFPDKILNRIDFKPLNCYICFVAWIALAYGFTLDFGLSAFSLAGIAALVAFNFNKLF